MHIPRAIYLSVKDKILSSDKIVIVYGPRQVGKTTLVRNILQELPLRKLAVNADEKAYADVLSSRDLGRMRLLVEGYDLLFIDEAQRITDISINLKLLHDNLPKLKIIATGSSSFELANQIKEPLTGRTWTFTLFPIAWLELKDLYNPFELRQKLPEYLVYGSYPEISSIPNRKDKVQYLNELSSSYLYKDILEITSIRYSSKINDLLRLLAFQVGSEVSLSELGSSLSMSKETVTAYIDLLEQAFIVFRLSGFSRNLRKEITKMDKVYFYDLGVRNTVINQLNPLEQRNDIGKLWENFLMIERRKLLAYQSIYAGSYFWRTYTGAELDYIEERDGKLYGYEFKYGKKTAKPPKTWLDTYQNASYQCISQENFHSFVTEEFD
jgi:predicted AAA+ superfamily ATPase